MKFFLIKSVRFAVALMLVQLIQGAATTEQGRISAEQYVQEINVWHTIFKMFKPDCSVQEACAALLKFDEVFYTPAPEPVIYSTSSDMTGGDTRFSKPIVAYIAELTNEYNQRKPIYILAEMQDVCAFMLKKMKRQRIGEDSPELLSHEKASKSCLWPSMKRSQDSEKMLADWHRICMEFIPNCSLFNACKMILMHQVAMLRKGDISVALYRRCEVAIDDQCKYFAALNSQNEPSAVYAYCIKYPLIALSDWERKELKNLRSCAEQNVLYEQREKHLLDNAPQYIKTYKLFLDSEEKMIRSAYQISAAPTMDLAWQKLVSVGYPKCLKTVLNDFHENESDMKNFYFLHGYPGGGKTTAARFLAMITERPLLEVRCAGIQTKYRGSAVENIEKILKPIFDSFQPWVICLDEIDALQKTDGNSNGGDSSQGRSSALTILQQMRDSCRNPNVIIVATSNYKEQIPESILSRLGIGSIYVPLPDYDARRTMAQVLLEKHGILFTEEILDIIAHGTGGYLSSVASGLSSRGISDVVLCIKLIAKRSRQKTNSFYDDLPYSATPEITKQAIETVVQHLSDGGQPITAQGRWIKETMESKHFWPGVQALMSFCGSSFSGFMSLAQYRLSLHQSQVSDGQLEIGQYQLDNSDLNTVMAHYNFEKSRSWNPLFDVREWKYNADRKIEGVRERALPRLLGKDWKTPISERPSKK